jgi:hypothetical protein
MINNTSVKIQAIVRYSLAHGISPIKPLYIVNEYPKSGGTWVGQMLGKSLNIPFPRNRIPPLASCVIHGHYLKSWGMKNVVIVWRDGRDMMVSWYHHCLYKYQFGNESIVKKVTRDLSIQDPEDVVNNLPRFLEYSFQAKLYPRFSWTTFVNKWIGNPNIVYVRYEDLRQNTVYELQRIIYELTAQPLDLELADSIVNEFSFENQSGRKIGEESKNNFLRKGIVGDWRNYFNREACEIFDYYAGDALVQLNYEKDHEWVKDNY